MFTELITNKKIIDENTVLVILSSYNREDKIIKSIESILNQTYNNIILHIIDDFSDDSTLQVILDYFKNNTHDNVIVTKSDINHGIYYNMNYFFDYHKDVTYGYWTAQGADDFSMAHRISTCIDNIGSFLGVGHKHMRAGVLNHSSEGLIVYKKEVFETIGYYDETRFGGDSEYVARLKTKKGNIIKELSYSLYLADFDEKCLSSIYDRNIRNKYVQKYSNEHRTGILFRDYKK